MLSESQKNLLSLVAEKNGKLNWYKISRAYVNRFGSPADLSESFKYLESEGLIESKPIDGEPLPQLYISEKGKTLL
jgi:hypothetical protein